MKIFREYNHYEILEIPADATDFEIRQAYKDMLQIYNEESSVTYSLFSNEERQQILGEIERAFAILIDKNTREAYNRTLVNTGKTYNHENTEEKQDITDTALTAKNVIENINENDHSEAVNQILSKNVVSGKDIRELREKMGIELNEIYEVTKINIPVLKALEEDNIEKLPSGIYVKYLLKQYIDFLGIDSKKLLDAYIKNINSADSNHS